MTRYSLDTDTVSAILKKDLAVSYKPRAKIHANHEIILCPVVYYELRRGLLDKGATRQIQALQVLVAALQ